MKSKTVRSQADILTQDSKATYETEARAALDHGQPFVAYDIAKAGLAQFPESLPLIQTAGFALIRTGAIAEAQALIAPLCAAGIDDKPRLDALRDAVRTTAPLLAGAGELSQEAIDALGHLADVAAAAHGAAASGGLRDEETLGLIARVYKELWVRSGNRADGMRARDAYLRAYRISAGAWTGINAASLSWALGDRDLATSVAAAVLRDVEQAPPSEGADDYWRLATLGEANLLLGRDDDATAAYWKAGVASGGRRGYVASSLAQLKLLQRYGMFLPLGIVEAMRPPCIAAFIGDGLGDGGRTGTYSAEWEAETRAEMDRIVDEQSIAIGYAAAAAGADLMFIEALQERGAETHIVMPCEIEDFVARCVAPSGDRWVARFRRAVKLATSIKYVTEEPSFGDGVLFGLAARMFYGFAEVHAKTLHTDPCLVTLAGWQNDSGAWPGDRIIYRLNVAPPPPPSAEPSSGPAALTSATDGLKPRQIKAMLFADVVGFSKLDEIAMPSFMYRFLTTVADKLPGRPDFVNTWGDGIFAVMGSAQQMAEYALAMQEVVCQTDWAQFGLPGQMSIRIGLHAGPVFEADDPIAGHKNYYGSHVNRAARIEPITIPGNVYASEQFVALLVTEQATERERNGRKSAILAEYLGVLDLAKKFASQPMYHLRRATKWEMDAPEIAR